MARRVDRIVPYEIPKRSGGVRVMATLSERDAAEWHRIAGTFALCATDGCVVGPRPRLRNGGWTMEPLRPSLERAHRAASALAARAPLVLRTDVRAFYPTLTPSAVHQTLHAIDPRGAARVAEMLDGWGSEGYAGFPIGPPASAVLADAVLAPIDAALGTRVLRWADDYLVACRNEREAISILDRLDIALARLGLERSDAKTRLLEPTVLQWPGTLSGG